MGQAHDILDRARKAREEKRFEDALRDHLWFHENALNVEPSMAGVRLSFALRDWIYLGEQFPLARRALQGLRDRDTARMLSGGATVQLFHDISAINSALGDERATQELFTQLDVQMPDLARQCADFALPALVASEDFALARRYIPQPLERVGALAQRLNAYVKELAKSGSTSSAPALLAYVLNYAKEVRLVLEVLLRQGDDEEAAAVSAAALDQLESAALRDAVQREFDNPGATIAAMVSHARGNAQDAADTQ